MKHDWEYKKLGEVAESDLGKTLNQSKDTGIFQPYLCSINIQWDAIDLSIVKQARFEESEFDRYSVKSGDLLVCEGGDTGRAAIWNGGPMLYQNALHRIRFNDRIIPRFALLYLRHLKMNGDIDSKYSKGVTIKHLVKSSLNSIPIPHPPLSTQQSIVSELDSLSKIIADCKETLKDYDALEQSIFYDMFGDPVKNEKGWEVKKLGDCYKVTSSKRIYLEELTDNGIPFLKVADVNNLINGECKPTTFISDEKYNELKINGYVPKANDLIVTARGTIGNVYIVKKEDAFYFQDGMITWLKQSNYNTDAIFIKNMFLVPCFLNYLEQFSNNSTVAFLSISKLANVYIPVPPLALQQTFASKIEAIEQMKVETKKALQEAETLFQARMDYWFN